jgi:hypothetical protein
MTHIIAAVNENAGGQERLFYAGSRGGAAHIGTAILQRQM